MVCDDARKGKKGKGKGKGKGRSSGPEYDPCTPCGYYLAGHCRYGSKCSLVHDPSYARAVRDQWLIPDDKARRSALEEAARTALPPDVCTGLFPRAFSRPVIGTSLPPPSPSPSSPSSSSSSSLFASSSSSSSSSPNSSLRWALVLDVEGKEEIIEFPVLLLDLAERKESGRFQRYVRPRTIFEGLEINEHSPATTLPTVLKDFDEWLRRSPLQCDLESLPSDAAFLTCGDFDCKQVHRNMGEDTPRCFDRWVNIKRSYSDYFGRDYRGMRSMLGHMGELDAQGHPRHGFHHLGMHDVENIARCALWYVQKGGAVEVNGSWRRT